MLQRIYLPKVTRSAMFTRAMCPSTDNGDTSSTRPTRSVGTGAPALQWGQHSPTADGPKASASMVLSLSGRLRSTIERSIFQSYTSRSWTRWMVKLCVMPHTASTPAYSPVKGLQSLGAAVRSDMLARPSITIVPRQRIGETPEQMLEGLPKEVTLSAE